jgi:hypothetical protein
MKRSIVLSGFLAALAVVAPASAQVPTPLGATPPASGSNRGSVAYDNKHDVYLHVYEQTLPSTGLNVMGRFINAAGAPVGSEFLVSTNRLSYGALPKVAYSRSDGADVFLVTYIKDLTILNNANLYGQLVRFTGQGPSGASLEGAAFPISPNINGPKALVYQANADVAFNPVTQQFLVAWEEYPGPDTFVRVVAPTGAMVTGPVNTTAGPAGGGQGAPTLAVDWQRNRAFVMFSGDNPNTGGFGVFGYLLNGSTGAVMSSLFVLQAGGNIEPAVAYLPERDGFLASWTVLSGGPRVTNARFIASTDTGAALPDPVFAAMFSNKSVGAPTLTYDHISRRVLMAAMRSLDPALGVVAGTVFDAMGTPVTGLFNMSTVPAAISGTYYPTIRTAEGGVFGMAYNNDYATAQFERFALPPAATPGPDCQGSNCPQPPPPPPPPVSGQGDFSGDGKPDIIWENTSGQVYAWFMNGTTYTGTGAFLSTAPIGSVWKVVGAADFNGDGKNDLLWQNQSTGQPYIYFYNGTQFIGEQGFTVAAGTPWRITGTGDFNKDGKTDIVWQNVTSGTVYVWFMSPSGGAASFVGGGYIQHPNLTPVTLPANTSWRVVGAGDVNQDTHVDLVWQDQTTGSLAAWYLQGLIIGGSLDVPTNDPRRVKAVGDYNGDGRPDLIVQSPTGIVEAFLLTPTSITGVSIWGAVNPSVWSIVGVR